VPLSTLVATTIGDVTLRQPLLALFDTGATHNFILQRVLPPGCKTRTITNIAIKTVSGLAKTQEQVNLCDIKFPEFTHSLCLNKVEYPCYVIDGASGIHDIILGTGFLNLHQIDPLPSTHTIRWGDYSVPWKSYAEFTDRRNYLRHVENIFDTSDEDVELFATHITPSSYHKSDTSQLASSQKHLNPTQQADLSNLFSCFQQLFSGQLGKYPHTKVHLDLIDNATPVHQRAYPVPHSQHQVFKDELDRLVQIGVLAPIGASEWAAPSFIIPKKDGSVRWVSDFRALNKVIKRRVYPLPRITDILHKRSGYKFFTKLDVSMKLYTFELDEASSHLCVIVTPFGKYRYLCLPMGVKQSPDIAQQIMEEVLQDIAETDPYMDDVGVFNMTWTEHTVCTIKLAPTIKLSPLVHFLATLISHTKT
jgi:hypothetical protein